MAAMAALGEMFLTATLGLLSLLLGPHWAVSEPEAKAWGQAFEAWLKAQPAKRRKAITNALGAVPTLNLAVTTGMILAPRVQMTLELSKRAKEGKGVKHERQTGTSGDSAGGGGQNKSSDGTDYVAAIAKALRSDAGGTSEGGSPSDSALLPKA